MHPSGRIRFEPFELDPVTGEMWRAGDTVHLQEKPLQLLMALLESPGDVVTREELQERLWADHTFVDFDHSINVAVSKLRETLGDSAEEPHFVETLPRRGYRFIAPVAVDDPVEPRPKRRRRWPGRIAAALLAFFAAYLVFERPWQSWRSADDVPEAGAESGIVQSVAVLPLRNTSGDPEQEYLADGITAAIITELGKIHALRVISWQSALQVKNSDASLPEIAYLLDVEAVVLGSVVRSDGRVRVDVQLVAADPERHLWAESYEGDLGDILGTHREVARAVAQEIRASVTPEEALLLASAPDVPPAAYDAYLKGLFQWNLFSVGGFRRAVEHYEAALAIAPDYAQAWSALADSWLMMGWYGHVPPTEALAAAEKAAGQALDLDPDSAAAHNSAAAVHYFKREYDEGDAHHELAIRLNPSYSLAHNWYSWSLADQGRHDEALAEIRLAQRLDPLSVVETCSVGIRLLDARRYDEAIRQFRHALDMNPYFCPALLYLGMASQQMGSYGEAIQVLDRAVEASGGEPTYVAALAAAHAEAGDIELAEQLLAQLLERADREYVSAYHVATIYVALGRADEAFEWLERAEEENSPWMSRIGIEAQLDRLRADPRFAALARRVGVRTPYDA